MKKGKRKALTQQPTKARVKGANIDNISLIFCLQYSKNWRKKHVKEENT
ncbi:hypothetical protein P7E14_13840 [Enterococcus gallinarum]|nr:hypothetical protein [Enterococcus gallinarum]MDT2724915.1 hypothetical protein [Enterococcus gallinarum]